MKKAQKKSRSSKNSKNSKRNSSHFLKNPQLSSSHRKESLTRKKSNK